MPETHLSRRRLLAASLPAAAVAATALKPTAAVASPASLAGAAGTPPATIAELRAMTETPAAAYLVIDEGRQGLYFYDATDQQSVDNAGTVLVTAGGARLKREIDGPINVRWFGATGDGSVDDGPAIQAAVDAAQAVDVGGAGFGRAVFLPAGSYAIGAPITLNPLKSIRVVGEGASQTFLRPHSSVTAMEAMIQFSGPSANRFQFSDFELVCGSAAEVKYGIVVDHITNATFTNLWIVLAKEAALCIREGWFNSIEYCWLYANDGDGLRLGPEEVNDFQITNCIINSNGTVGINLQGRTMQQIRVNGCTVSGNDGSGIIVDADVKSLDISDNYFENNNKIDNGNPPYADVVIKSGHQIGPVQLANNYVWMTFPKDKARDFVACYSTRGGLRLTNNHLTKSSIHLAPSALLRTATTAADTDNVLERLVISGTFAERFTDTEPYSPVEVDDLAGGVTQLHDAVVDDVFKANYSAPLLRFAPVSRPARGTWRKSPEEWRRHDVWALAGDANAGQWGFIVDVDAHPELAGKLVYFACMAKASASGTTVVLSTSQLGPQQAGPVPDLEWQLLSYVDRLPASGTVTFSVGAASADAASTVSFAHPVLSEVGVPYRLQDPA